MTQMDDGAQQVRQQGTPGNRSVLCPMCDYDLRGTTEPRCPECGFRFDWDELLDPTRRQHPYLYEHRTLDPFASFWRTLLNGLRPWRFWKTLHPAQPSNPRRLRQYFLWCMLPLILATGAALTMQIMADHQLLLSIRAQEMARINIPQMREGLVKQFGSIEAYIARVNQESPTMLSWEYLVVQRGPTFRQILFWPLLPLLQFAALMIFQASMRRARVKVIHVWRCVVYSWDPALIAGLVLCTAAALSLAHIMPFIGRWPILGGQSLMGPPVRMVVFVQWAMLPLLFVAGLKLAAAYRLYLRFSHPELTILSIQIILFLLIATLASLHVI